MNPHGQPSILLGNYYFSSQYDYTTFSSSIDHTLSQIAFSKYCLFINGDFNRLISSGTLVS